MKNSKNLKTLISQFVIILLLLQIAKSQSSQKNGDITIEIEEEQRPIRSFTLNISSCEDQKYIIKGQYLNTSKNYLYIEELYGKLEVRYSNSTDLPSESDPLENTVHKLDETLNETFIVNCIYPGAIKLHFIEEKTAILPRNARTIVRLPKNYVASYKLKEGGQQKEDKPLTIYITKGFSNQQLNLAQLYYKNQTKTFSFQDSKAELTIEVKDRDYENELLTFITGNDDNVILIITCNEGIEYDFFLSMSKTPLNYQNFFFPFNKIVDDYNEITIILSDIKQDFWWFYSKEPSVDYANGIPLANLSREKNFVDHTQLQGGRFLAVFSNPFNKYNSTSSNYYFAVSFTDKISENYAGEFSLHNDTKYYIIKLEENRIVSELNFKGAHTIYEFQKDKDLNKEFYVLARRCGKPGYALGYSITNHLRGIYGKENFTNTYNIKKFDNLYAMEIQIVGKYKDDLNYNDNNFNGYYNDEEFYGFVLSYFYNDKNSTFKETDITKYNDIHYSFQYNKDNKYFSWDKIDGANYYEIYIFEHTNESEENINNDCYLLHMKEISEENETVVYIQSLEDNKYRFNKEGKFMVNVVAHFSDPLPHRVTFDGQSIENTIDIKELKEDQEIVNPLIEYNQHLYYTKLREYDISEENALIYFIDEKLNLNSNKESFKHFYCKIISADPNIDPQELKKLIPTTEEQNECASERDSVYSNYYFIYFKVSIAPKENETLFLLTNIEYELEETPIEGQVDKIKFNSKIENQNLDVLLNKTQFQISKFIPKFIKYTINDKKDLSYAFYCTMKHYQTIYIGNITKDKQIEKYSENPQNNKVVLNENIISRQLVAFSNSLSSQNTITIRLFGPSEILYIQMEKTEGHIIYDPTDTVQYGKAYPYYSLDCSQPNYIIGSYETSTKGMLYIERMYGNYKIYYKENSKEFLNHGILPTEDYILDSDTTLINSDLELVMIKCVRRGIVKVHFIPNDIPDLNPNSKHLFYLPNDNPIKIYLPKEQTVSDLYVDLSLAYNNKKENISIFHNGTKQKLTFENGKCSFNISWIERTDEDYIEAIADLKYEILSVIATESELEYYKIDKNLTAIQYRYLYFPLKKIDNYLSAKIIISNISNDFYYTYTRERFSDHIPITEHTEFYKHTEKKDYVELVALNPYDKYNSSNEYDFYFSFSVIPDKHEQIDEYNVNFLYLDKPSIKKAEVNTVSYISNNELYLFEKELEFIRDQDISKELVICAKKCGGATGYNLNNFGTVLEKVNFNLINNVNILESFGLEDIQISMINSQNSNYDGFIFSYINNDEEKTKFDKDKILRFNNLSTLEITYDSNNQKIKWNNINDTSIDHFELFIMNYTQERYEYIDNDCFLTDLKNKKPNGTDILKIIELNDTEYEYKIEEGQFLVNVIAVITTPIKYRVTYKGIVINIFKKIEILEEEITKEFTAGKDPEQFIFASGISSNYVMNDERLITSYASKKNSYKFLCKLVSAKQGDMDTLRKNIPLSEAENECAKSEEYFYDNYTQYIFTINKKPKTGEILYIVINFIHSPETDINDDNDDYSYSLTVNKRIEIIDLDESYKKTITVHKAFIPSVVKYKISSDYKKSFALIAETREITEVFFGNILDEQDKKSVGKSHKNFLVVYNYNKEAKIKYLTIKLFTDLVGEHSFYFESTNTPIDYYTYPEKQTITYTYNISNCKNEYYLALDYELIDLSSHILIDTLFGQFKIAYRNKTQSSKDYLFPKEQDILPKKYLGMLNENAEILSIKCTSPGAVKISMIEDTYHPEFKPNTRNYYNLINFDNITLNLPTGTETEKYTNMSFLIYSDWECKIDATLREEEKTLAEIKLSQLSPHFEMNYLANEGKKITLVASSVCDTYFYVTVTKANLFNFVKENQTNITFPYILIPLKNTNDYFSQNVIIRNVNNNFNLIYERILDLMNADKIVSPLPATENSFKVLYNQLTNNTINFELNSPYLKYKESTFDIYYLAIQFENTNYNYNNNYYYYNNYNAINPYSISISYKEKPTYLMLKVKDIGVLSSKSKNQTAKYQLEEDTNINITFIVKKIGKKPQAIKLTSYDEEIYRGTCYRVYNVFYFKNVKKDIQVEGIYSSHNFFENDDDDYYGFYITYFYANGVDKFDEKAVEQFNDYSVNIKYDRNKRRFIWEDLNVSNKTEDKVEYEIYILSHNSKHKKQMKNDFYLESLKEKYPTLKNTNDEKEFIHINKTNDTFYTFNRIGKYDVNIIAKLKYPLPFTVTFAPQIEIEVEKKDNSKKVSKIVIFSLLGVIVGLVAAFLLYIILRKRFNKNQSSEILKQVENVNPMPLNV